MLSSASSGYTSSERSRKCDEGLTAVDVLTCDTWTWNNESKRLMNGKAVRARLTLKQVSPDSVAYKFEMGAPDEPMKLVTDGKQTRMRRPLMRSL
jgi:hypothetical protein